MIEFKNVNFSYKFNKPILKNINAKFENGKSYAIIGHTGCGKSTLIRLMNGLLKPQSGHILVDEIDITKKNTDLKSVRKNVGIVFQYPEHQLFAETVKDDIEFGPKNIELTDIDNKVKKAIETVGLSEDILSKSPFNISGGEQRKTAIAGILAMEPQTLILDEPTAGLDPSSSKELFKTLRKLKRNNKTIIFASHTMRDTALFADEIYVINNGEIFMHGTPAEIFKNAQALYNIGLALPQITELSLKLKDKGFNIHSSFTVEDFLEEIGFFL